MQSELGQLLREERLKKGLSLREFSKRLGISHTYLAKLEGGEDPRTGKPVEPTVESLDKIASGLNRSRQEIFLMAKKNIYGELQAEETELSDYVQEFVAGLKSKKLYRGGKALDKEELENLCGKVLKVFSL